MTFTLGLVFGCPVCGQQIGGAFDFSETPSRVVACMPCQTRFRVHLDRTVAVLNRDLPEFDATVLTSNDD